MKTIAVINLGLKNIRIIVFDDSGKQLYIDVLPVTTFLADKTVEQDATQWWEHTCKLLENLSLRSDFPEISYLTVTSSSSCLICVDKNLQPVIPVIMVSDSRVESEYQSSNIALKVNNQLSKINWVKKNIDQKIVKSIQWYLSPNDFLIARLTGQIVTDPLNAGKASYSETDGKYDEEILSQFSILNQSLPAVVPIGTKIGNIKNNECLFKNLEKTKVYITTYDAICAFWASGVNKTGDVADISGTVTSVRMLSSNVSKISSKNLFVQRGFIKNQFIVGGSNNLGGGLLEWTRQSFYKDSRLPYEQMEMEALIEGESARGLLFLPYLLGERAPIWDLEARGVLWGLERYHKRGAIVRAIFESCAFIIKGLIQNITKQNQSINRIFLSGGLSRVDLVSEIKSDCLGTTVLVVDNYETTALGAALIVLHKTGYYKNILDASKQIIKIRKQYYPRNNEQRYYEKKFKLYNDIYKANAKLFPKIKELKTFGTGLTKALVESL